MSDAFEIGVGSPIAHHIVGGTFQNFTIDATNDFLYWVFTAPEAITITRLGFRYGVRTGTPVQHQISLQGVATDGKSDGTVKGATNNALALFTPPADATWNGTWQWQTLGESAAVTRGQRLSIVIQPGGTPDGSNSSSFTHSISLYDRQGMPCAVSVNAGTHSRGVNFPVYGYSSASKVYGRPLESLTTTSYSSGGTNEFGITFNLPGGWGKTFKVKGVRWFGTTANSSGDSCTISLYDSDGDPGTVLQTVVHDFDDNSTVGNTRAMEVYFDEASLTALNFGSTYHLGIKADQASVAMTDYVLNMDTADNRAAWPGGENFNACTRAGSTWIEDTTSRGVMELIIDDWSEPTAGTPPLMASVIA